MPPVRNARRTSCPIPSSERAEIPNFRTCSILNLWTRPMSSFWTYLFRARLCHTSPAANGSSAVLRARRSSTLVLAAWMGVSRPYLHYGDRGRLKNVSPPSFLFESSPIFLQYTGDTDAKNDGPEFWNSNSVIFQIFFEIFKKASHSPSAADLDHYGRGQTRSQ